MDTAGRNLRYWQPRSGNMCPQRKQCTVRMQGSARIFPLRNPRRSQNRLRRAFARKFQAGTASKKGLIQRQNRKSTSQPDTTGSLFCLWRQTGLNICPVHTRCNGLSPGFLRTSPVHNPDTWCDSMQPLRSKPCLFHIKCSSPQKWHPGLQKTFQRHIPGNRQ